MPSFSTTPVKSFRPQIIGNRSPSTGHMGILIPRFYYSTSSASVNVLTDLPPVPDPYWSLYEEDYYIGEIDASDINSVYTSEINKVTCNPGNSRHYDTSNPCDVCGKNGNTFDECELFKNYDFLKIHCTKFSL